MTAAASRCEYIPGTGSAVRPRVRAWRRPCCAHPCGSSSRVPTVRPRRRRAPGHLGSVPLGSEAPRGDRVLGSGRGLRHRDAGPRGPASPLVRGRVYVSRSTASTDSLIASVASPAASSTAAPPSAAASSRFAVVSVKASAAASERVDHPSPSDDLYLHETVFGWEGWSLSVPRPGKLLGCDQWRGAS